jgi:hypothetical protein
MSATNAVSRDVDVSGKDEAKRLSAVPANGSMAGLGTDSDRASATGTADRSAVSAAVVQEGLVDLDADSAKAADECSTPAI